MNFDAKSHKASKTRNYLKSSNLLLIYNTSKSNNKKWRSTEQNFKTLGLTFYKVPKGITANIMKTSIYMNYVPLISGTTFFLGLGESKKPKDLKKINKSLKHGFVKTGIKINNKIYLPVQTKNVSILSYKHTMFNLNKTILKYSKIANLLKSK